MRLYIDTRTGNLWIRADHPTAKWRQVEAGEGPPKAETVGTDIDLEHAVAETFRRALS